MLMRIQPTLAWLRIAEVLISLASTYVLFFVGREMFGFRPGISAYILGTFYVPLLWLIPPVLSENLWVLLMLLAYLFLLRTRTHLQQSPWRNRIPAILFLALATLVRPGAVFLLPFFCWWIVHFSGWRPALLACALYCLVLAPWIINVSLTEGRFVFIASEGGVTFWIGTHPRYSGDGDMAVNPEVQRDYREILRVHQGTPAAKKEKYFFIDGLANIVSHPVTWCWIEIRKLVLGLLPFGASVMQTSILHRITGVAFYLAVLAGALIAIRHASSEARILLCGIAASYVVMILLFIPQERFRIAMLDPILLLFAASELSRRVKRI
jgi:hypothetical protein